jgi:hypothetical protein
METPHTVISIIIVTVIIIINNILSGVRLCGLLLFHAIPSMIFPVALQGLFRHSVVSNWFTNSFVYLVQIGRLIGF